MGHAQSSHHDERLTPRLYLPAQTVLAALPPPEIWNWFAHCQQAWLLNVSPCGLCLLSSRPLAGDIHLRICYQQICYEMHGTVCHQTAREQQFYVGITSYPEAQASLIGLFDELTT